jgi:hypothetical protein
MKLYRQLKIGESIPENAHATVIGGVNTPAEILIPLPVSDDPDAGAKAAWQAYFETDQDWEECIVQENFRAAATAAVAAAVPGLVKERDRANAEFLRASKEAADRNAQLIFAVKRNAQLTSENESLRNRIAELENHIANGAAWNSKDSLLLERDELRKRIAELEQERSELKNKMLILNSQYQKTKDDAETAIAELDKVYIAQIEELEAKLKAAQQPQPPKLIPATLELIQRHGTETVVYRNGEKPLQVATIPQLPGPIITVHADGRQHSHSQSGRMFSNFDSYLDLLMPEPAPRMKELWVAVTKKPNDSGGHSTGYAYPEKWIVNNVNNIGHSHIIRIEIPEEDAQ